MDLWLPFVYMSILAQTLLACLRQPIPAHEATLKEHAPEKKMIQPDSHYDLMMWCLVIMLYFYPKVTILVTWRTIALIFLHVLGPPFLCIIRANLKEWED